MLSSPVELQPTFSFPIGNTILEVLDRGQGLLSSLVHAVRLETELTDRLKVSHQSKSETGRVHREQDF